MVVVEPGLAGVRNALKRGVRQVIRATLDDAGLLPESLPGVGLFDVLEHMQDDSGFLTRLYNLTAPGGRLYLTVPAYPWLWSQEDETAGHFRRYTMGQLRHALREAGYIVEFATYIFSFLPIPIFLRRVLPYRLGLAPAGFSVDTVRSDHAPAHPLVIRTLEACTRYEFSRISRQRRFPFGGSCLAVARKR